MRSKLAAKSCEPCRGGMPPMTADEAKSHIGQVPGWELNADARRIERCFSFGNFREALDFVNEIGELAEAEGHHPEIHFGWGYCRVEIFTHKIGGLHQNDFILAAKINDLAAYWEQRFGNRPA
jgi:4a-hydroxytetrahydrobiopterin dehydratase